MRRADVGLPPAVRRRLLLPRLQAQEIHDDIFRTRAHAHTHTHTRKHTNTNTNTTPWCASPKRACTAGLRYPGRTAPATRSEGLSLQAQAWRYTFQMPYISRFQKRVHACANSRTHARAHTRACTPRVHEGTQTRAHTLAHTLSHSRTHARTHSPCRLWWNEEWGGAEGWYNYFVGQV